MISRSEECRVPPAARKRRATRKSAKDMPPRRGRRLLGCNFVTHRSHTAEGMLRSSFLVSLQNRSAKMSTNYAKLNKYRFIREESGETTGIIVYTFIL